MAKKKAKKRKGPCVSFFPELIRRKKEHKCRTAKALLKAEAVEMNGEGEEAFDEFKQDHEECDTWGELLEAIDMIIAGKAIVLLEKFYPDDGSLETLEEMAKLVAEKHPKLDTETFDSSEGEDHEGCFSLVGFKK